MSIIESTTEASFTRVATELTQPGKAEETVEAAVATKADLTVTKLVSTDEQQITSASDGQTNDVKPSPLTTEQLEKIAQQLQDFVGEMNRGLEFSVDEDSGRNVIKVIDKETGDVVKQYPSEEVLTLVANLSDMVGGFVDAKV